jgi:AmpE protein
MTLITLLIVLTIERIGATGQLWQFDFYYMKMKSLMLNHLGRPQWLQSAAGRWVWLLLPVLIVQFLTSVMGWLLLEFVFDVLVLLICIGCVKQRKIYKSFLNAANRGDDEASALYAAQLRGLQVGPLEETQTDDEMVVANMENENTDEDEQAQQSQDPVLSDCTSLGQTLVWFNFRYYCAVLFWFVCLGPAGVVLYCMVRESADDNDPDVSDILPKAQMNKLLHIMDWFPARVCSAGYLLIGNFNKSAGIWLSYLLDFSSSAKSLVSEIANAAETVETADCINITEPACMLKLAKRNILFFLAMVAVLTLYGGIR